MAGNGSPRYYLVYPQRMAISNMLEDVLKHILFLSFHCPKESPETGREEMVQLRSLLQATAFLALGRVAQAGRDEEVSAAKRVMGDLPEELVRGFCVERVGYPRHRCSLQSQSSAIIARISGMAMLRSMDVDILAAKSTSTWPSTLTSFSTPTPLPGVSTVTHATTITVATTSTLFVPATAPPTTPTKRVEGRFIPYNRATWCSDYGVPCRLAQYDGWVVDGACERFLGSGEWTEGEGECEEEKNENGIEREHNWRSDEEDLEEAAVDEAMEDWKFGAK